MRKLLVLSILLVFVFGAISGYAYGKDAPGCMKKCAKTCAIKAPDAESEKADSKKETSSTESKKENLQKQSKQKTGDAIKIKGAKKSFIPAELKQNSEKSDKSVIFIDKSKQEQADPAKRNILEGKIITTVKDKKSSTVEIESAEIEAAPLPEKKAKAVSEPLKKKEDIKKEKSDK